MIVEISRKIFQEDRHGSKFADVFNDPDCPFDEVLAFFNQEDRQRRMEESELHHDRAPLAGVVRELEAQPSIDAFLAGIHPRRSMRLRQAIGVLVRMIMERRGWKKTGKKGSLGVRATATDDSPTHNTGGLAFWFVRAERYESTQVTPYPSVQERCNDYPAKLEKPSKPSKKRPGKKKRPGSKRTARRTSSTK